MTFLCVIKSSKHVSVTELAFSVMMLFALMTTFCSFGSSSSFISILRFGFFFIWVYMAALCFFFSLDFLELDAMFSEVIFCFCLIAFSCFDMSNFGFWDREFCWWGCRGSYASVRELSNWLLTMVVVVAGLIYLGRSYLTLGFCLSLPDNMGAKLRPTTFTGGTFRFG